MNFPLYRFRKGGRTLQTAVNIANFSFPFSFFGRGISGNEIVIFGVG